MGRPEPAAGHDLRPRVACVGERGKRVSAVGGAISPRGGRGVLAPSRDAIAMGVRRESERGREVDGDGASGWGGRDGRGGEGRGGVEVGEIGMESGDSGARVNSNSGARVNSNSAAVGIGDFTSIPL